MYINTYVTAINEKTGCELEREQREVYVRLWRGKSKGKMMYLNYLKTNN